MQERAKKLYSGVRAQYFYYNVFQMYLFNKIIILKIINLILLNRSAMGYINNPGNCKLQG